jgi:serine/threonine-protein kinase
MTKRRLVAAAVALFATALATAVPVQAGDDTFAAIAYSPSTGLYGFGNGYSTKDEALEKALQECGGKDALTKWCRNAWIALAVSKQTPGGYGWAWGETAGEARRAAEENCREHNPDAQLMLCISSER